MILVRNSKVEMSHFQLKLCFHSCHTQTVGVKLLATANDIFVDFVLIFLMTDMWLYHIHHITALWLSFSVGSDFYHSVSIFIQKYR